MRRTLLTIMSAVGLASASPGAAAVLLGSTVEASLRFPTFDAIFASAGPIVVDGGVEFPAGAFAGSTNFQIDVTDTQVIFQALTDAAYGGGFFNGFLLEFAGASPITQLTINSGSTITPVSFAFSADSLQFDVAGVSVVAGDRLVLDIGAVAPIPEPATWTMLIAGFGLVGGALRSGWWTMRLELAGE